MTSDPAGNLYGATYSGGTYGNGTVFELTPKAGGRWTEKILHSFSYGKGGYSPNPGLILDAVGNVYGTTIEGGSQKPATGTASELTPEAGGRWAEKVLHSFGADKGGGIPSAGMIFDGVGNLYGTTAFGGAYDEGTVFELTPRAGGGWTEKLLHSFGKNTDGFMPLVSLALDAAGNLYGATNGGGTYGYGTVFELTPKAGGGWTEKVLHSFGNNADGSSPSGVVLDTAGNLYGTTSTGGAYNRGTVFEITP